MAQEDLLFLRFRFFNDAETNLLTSTQATFQETGFGYSAPFIMASASFRDSMNTLSWSRKTTDAQPSTSQSSNSVFSRLQSLNPFGGDGHIQLPAQDNSGAPLPASSRREEEEGWLTCGSRDALYKSSAILQDSYSVGAL